MKTLELQCYGCTKSKAFEYTAKREALKVARAEGWSLGQDGRWHCTDCRPRRFGESWTEYDNRKLHP